jgi:hypothetical protein
VAELKLSSSVPERKKRYTPSAGADAVELSKDERAQIDGSNKRLIDSHERPSRLGGSRFLKALSPLSLSLSLSLSKKASPKEEEKREENVRRLFIER